MNGGRPWDAPFVPDCGAECSLSKKMTAERIPLMVRRSVDVCTLHAHGFVDVPERSIEGCPEFLLTCMPAWLDQ